MFPPLLGLVYISGSWFLVPGFSLEWDLVATGPTPLEEPWRCLLRFMAPLPLPEEEEEEEHREEHRGRGEREEKEIKATSVSFIEG